MNRRAIMLATLAAIAILALWYVALWNPAHKAADRARQRAAAAQQQQAQLETAIARLRSAQRDEPLQRARLEALRTAIPDAPNLAQFILDANDAASRAGIDFISIAPSEPRAAGAGTGPAAPATSSATGAAGPAPAEVAISIQIKGGYFQVLDYLNRLDRLPRLLVTDTINVASDANGSLTVGLSGRMFVRSIPGGFPGAAGSTTTTAPGGSTTTTTAPGTTTTTGARP